jgi:hypothetical protein
MSHLFGYRLRLMHFGAFAEIGKAPEQSVIMAESAVDLFGDANQFRRSRPALRANPERPAQ